MNYLVTYWYWSDGVKVPCCIYYFCTHENMLINEVKSYARSQELNYDGFFVTKHEEIIEY